MWTFWTQKVDCLNFTPLNPLTNTHFLPILWLKVELLAWGVHCTAPPGYHNGPGSKVAVNVTDSCRSEVLSKELVTSLILIVEIMKRAEMG